MATPKFASVSQSFHTELKKRVQSYFAEAGKPFTGEEKIYTKAGILAVSFFSCSPTWYFLRQLSAGPYWSACCLALW